MSNYKLYFSRIHQMTNLKDHTADQYEVDAEPLRSETSAPKLEDTLADYQPPKRYVKKDEVAESRGGPSVFITQSTESKGKTPNPIKNLGGAGADNMCKRCNKRVYEMEKMIADKSIYHKMCFRCQHCKRILSLGNFAAIDGQPYCKPHFIELFKKKGKYDMVQQTTLRNEDGPQGKEEQTNSVGAEEQHDSYSSSPAPTRENGLYDEEDVEVKEVLKEEPVRYVQMNSVRNMFETASRSSPTAPAMQAKKPSKWDKLKEPARVPSPARQREPEQEEEEYESEIVDAEVNEEQLPPAAITRNLVARFRELEQSAGEIIIVDRKPVHKITPPRDELAEGIEEALYLHERRERSPEPSRDPNIVLSGDVLSSEEEMPPAQLTRNMLAKFKSLEDVNQPAPPSPQQTASTKKTPPPERQQVQQQKARQVSRASPDSGIVDVEHHPHVNGDRQTDDEDDENAVEKELPEQGFTKSLLARWRCIEEQSPEPVARKQTKPTSKPQQPQTAKYRDPSPPPQEEYHQEELNTDNGLDYEDGEVRREIIRESDTNEEDFLPPPSCTRNMLAKFQNLEAEAEKQAHEQTAPSRKHFKWTVKEAPLINRSGMVWQEKRKESSFDEDHGYNHYEDNNRDDDDGHYDDHYDNHEDRDQQFYENVDHEHIYEEPVEARSRDIVHSDSPADNEDELPPQAFTKNMLAKFRSLEIVEGAPPSPLRAELQQKEAYKSNTGPGVRTYSSSSGQGLDSQMSHIYSDDDLGEDNYEEREYYEGDINGGEYENEPFHNPDVVREEDRNEEEELPERGTTRNLLTRFQSIEAAH